MGERQGKEDRMNEGNVRSFIPRGREVCWLGECEREVFIATTPATIQLFYQFLTNDHIKASS